MNLSVFVSCIYFPHFPLFVVWGIMSILGNILIVSDGFAFLEYNYCVQCSLM